MVKHTFGILAHPDTDEVPGTVRLLSKDEQQPLGVDRIERKRTADGIILDPQPDDHPDDPLNWSSWRRDAALLSLGWHCLVGGGMTPVLAAAFNDVSATFDVSIPKVALTTGLYMLGLGIGVVITSPTALIFGKRPVYLVGVIVFFASAIWAAASQSYGSLVAARIFMGIGVSPCESLPSSTIAEIFFLHERAYRVGIYTLLLLGGKNIVPLVSAAITNSLGWRWVFWIVTIIVGFNFFLLFFFVPETFWDRTPRPKSKSNHTSIIERAASSIFAHGRSRSRSRGRSRSRTRPTTSKEDDIEPINVASSADRTPSVIRDARANRPIQFADAVAQQKSEKQEVNDEKDANALQQVPTARQVYKMDQEKTSRESLDTYVRDAAQQPVEKSNKWDEENGSADSGEVLQAKPFRKLLKVHNGRIQHFSWFRAAFRPFVLFAYPAILWSALIYSFSIGWLIVMSETVAKIYEANPYNFSALTTGLMYISPFIGGILGTAVAGKISDFIVRFMTRRNDGIYEPEFRLIMGIPVAITTALGLMGFGWSAQNQDSWIVPTIFFGVISFGCSLGSTTAITFAVDSYRQYSLEALVTLNFSKNVLHGFVFSLFFNSWLAADGSKNVFLVLGGLQLAALILTIPLYIYGKRCRNWTLNQGFMDRWTK